MSHETLPETLPEEPVEHADIVESTEFVGWFSFLFPAHDYATVGAVSAGAGVGIFLVGYVITAVGGLPYLDLPESYLQAFAVFWMLSWLGVADDSYVEVWNRVRPAFDVDDETYDSVVRPTLEAIHHGRSILVFWAVIAIPYFVLISLAYLPEAPMQDRIIDVFLGGSSDYDPSVLAAFMFYLFGAVDALLLATIVNGFVKHLELVRDVSELPFQDIHASASALEPIASFTVASSTVWFLGVTFILVWMHVGISGSFGLGIVALLVFAGSVFFLAPQLLLHDALMDAKRALLVEIRREYRDLLRDLERESTSSEAVSLRLKLVDRRLENAKAIRTWVYNFTSIGKLAVASVIPWLTLLQELLKASEFVP